MSTKPRGIRNHNPGNIERSSANKWQGRMPEAQMTFEQRAERRFEVFISPAWGIRAICVLLIAYFDRHGCDTVEKIIQRWAPPNENNTRAYIQAVAKAVVTLPDVHINLHDFRVLRPLVEAIIAHENAGHRYPSAVVEEGLRLAGVVNPVTPLVPQPTAAQAATVTALATGGSAAVVEGISQLMPVVHSVNQVASTTAGLSPTMRGVILLLVAVSIGASFFAWYRLRGARKAVPS